MRSQNGLTLTLAAVLLAAGAGYCQYLEATIPVGVSPCDVLWNPTSNKVYVTDDIENTITIIDGASNQVSATRAVPGFPTGLCWNSVENKVYCTSGESDRLAVIDGVGDSILTLLRIRDYPCDMAYNASMNKLYVAQGDAERVTVVDGAADTVMRTISVPGGVESMLWHPVTSRLFCVTCYDSMCVIDCVTDEVVSSIYTGAGYPYWCYNPVNRLAYLGGSMSLA